MAKRRPIRRTIGDSKLGAYMRAARGRTTQEEVSEKMCVKRDRLIEFENGRRMPRVDELCRFAEVLKLSIAGRRELLQTYVSVVRQELVGSVRAEIARPSSTTIDAAVLGPGERHLLAVDLVTRAIEKVRTWGERAHQDGKFDWHILGHALQFVHEAIDTKNTHQRAWSVAADIYHRIGFDDLAWKCAKKSRDCARLQRRQPGEFLLRVETHLKSGYPFNDEGKLTRPEGPEKRHFEERFATFLDADELDNKIALALDSE